MCNSTKTQVPGKGVKPFDEVFEPQGAAKSRKEPQRAAIGHPESRSLPEGVIQLDDGRKTAAMRETTNDAMAENANSLRDELLTKRELAARLKKSERSIEYWQKRGFIPALRTVRSVLYSWNDVCRSLRQQRIGFADPAPPARPVAPSISPRQPAVEPAGAERREHKNSDSNHNKNNKTESN